MITLAIPIFKNCPILGQIYLGMDYIKVEETKSEYHG